ncbi:MAG: DUF3160 domain-containing protein [Candidatus Micrarchaeota archaeon]
MQGKILLALMVSLLILTSGCENVPEQKPYPTGPSTLEIEPIDLSGVETEKLSFLKYYSLEALNITLSVSQYNLPLETSDISNYDDFSGKITLSEDALALLKKNGFVVIKNPLNQKEEDITTPYKKLKDRDVPIFITSDSLLHLYHIQFDETLRQIEEREFYGMIWDISKEMLEDSVEKYDSATGDLKEASRRNTAYFAVGLSLLQPKENQLCERNAEYDRQCEYDPGFASSYFTREELQKYTFEVPDFVKEDVGKELELIEKHEGFSVSPVFRYNEDYSQYVPRGHYTRSEKLKNYFKAFMWCGRITFLIKKDLIKSQDPERDAKIQTMGASLIASKFAESEELRDKWNRIYSVTAFYVGLSDDLGPHEYIEALDSVFSGSFDPNDLTDDNIGKLKLELARFESPKIYGGTGACDVPLNSSYDEYLKVCLENTKGMRLMGQRFIPDSYMFTNLVGFDYLGNKNPFTMVIDARGMKIRGFPRGLDVMAILGSERAKELLDELDDSNYKGYEGNFSKLKEEFDLFNASEWNKNLYWSWLFSLKSLLKEYGTGYPTFMQTTAWQDKQLTTALASWSQLRHDTILYAKQSYTMGFESSIGPPPPPRVVGYVEPVPEFYNRLLALTRMTNKGLTGMDVLDKSSQYRLQRLEGILGRLVNISEKELENEELSEEDYDFINDFGDELEEVISEVEEKAKKTTIIADVHTDQNSKQVLEEGTGYVKFIVVAYKLPDSRILVGAGPVFSYYEFKQPMSDRLTDEKWRELLEPDPPDELEWVPNFAE